MAPSRISIQVSDGDRAKLRNLQQRTARNYACARRVETLPNGAAQDFEIWTDHQNLQYFRKPQKLNRRQARWVTELAEYTSLSTTNRERRTKGRLIKLQSRSRTGEGGQ